MITRPITTSDVIRQLRADLIGKDSYRGVTLTYTWLANQFGHFSLGFIPTFFIFKVLSIAFLDDRAAFFSAVIVSFLWTFFELGNFLGPLLLGRKARADVAALSVKKYTFRPAWENIAFDTITDICFFLAGTWTASLVLHPNWLVGYIVAALALILVYPCSYWYRTKLFLQTAQYPFQFRLSQWDADISDADKETVLGFLKNQSVEKHLFVFGGQQSGKTSISVGIATERSIRHHTCAYTTGTKLYSMCFEPDEEPSPALWTWRNASVLVIDDINPDVQAGNDLVTPDEFLRMLDGATIPNIENREIIKNKNVIWVMGNEDSEPTLYHQWRKMLLDIGVSDDNILAINIQAKKVR